MSVMLIANNCTRENGSFMGDQLCALKAAHMFAKEPGVDRVLMSMSHANEMSFLWVKFMRDFNVEPVYDNWNPGDWESRWTAWDTWRKQRVINGVKFDHYRELYLRIHGGHRQNVLCGHERGLGRRNIYEYWYYGQESMANSCVGSDVYDIEIDHPPLTRERDVWISPHCKTQGNVVFTIDFWQQVTRRLIDAGVNVTIGWDQHFCEDLSGHPLYRKVWGTHEEWMNEVCKHKLVACGNTGTGWLAAACGVPLFTMEPPNSQMPDHRYRECGLRNLVEVVDTPDPEYVARRLIEEVQRGETKESVARRSALATVYQACLEGERYSVNPMGKLQLMAGEFLRVADLPGDVVDLGAYRGGASLILRRLRPNKMLHVFDTWEGTPYDDPLCHHKKGEWKADLADVIKLLGQGTWYYYKGTFPYSVEWALATPSGLTADTKFCFVYVDMDTYQATKDAIEFFWPRMVVGGVILFDDYGWEPCAGVKKAVDEVFACIHFPNQVRVVQSQYACVVEKR